MLDGKRISRRRLLRKAAALSAGLAMAGPILAACGPTPTPQIIKEVVKETVIKEVPKEVVKEVTKIVAGTPQVVKETIVVEKPVTKVVEKEVVKLVTPTLSKIVLIRYHARASAAVKPGGTEWPLHLDAVNEFKAKNPNIDVKLEEIAVQTLADYYVKLMTMIAGGTVGDFTWDHTSDEDHQRLAYQNALYPVDEFVKAEGIDLKQYSPAAIDTASFEGKLYGLPFTMHPGGSSFYILQ